MALTEREALRVLLQDVGELRQEIVAAESRQEAAISAVQERHRYSARNLVHYVELRRHDVRDLQARLSTHGLTSLGRTESHVLAGIDGLLHTLSLLAAEGEDEWTMLLPEHVPAGPELLARNAINLLGPQPPGRSTRIMVTLPSEAGSDPALVLNMMGSGMDIVRINCAHDGPPVWDAMIANVRAAEHATGRSCQISMDLGGPKLRTGPIQPGPQVLRVKPTRNMTGTLISPARIWLGERPEGEDLSAVGVVPVLPVGWAVARRPGEELRLTDARGSDRVLTVEKVTDEGCLASVVKTVYFVPGTVVTAGNESAHSDEASARVGPLPAAEQVLLVHRGDRIVLTRDMAPTAVSTDGVHRIGCTLPEVFADAKLGERVWLDDGKIGGVIAGFGDGELTVEVLSAGATTTKLRAEKGINVPDTRLSISALTSEDIEHLEYVKEHADIVSMSFVRRAEDVRDLFRRVDPVTDQALDIVLKIETVAAFESLPQILLELMRWEDVGVMIARGDLAVEAGFERLAEVQEEILWLCEAAHVPVIWATQVLDTMARTGLPSRAEVTDAAMAERAECVMLNKGPFIDDAITMLAGILVRMEEHTQKKRSLLRRLRSWDLDIPTFGAGALPTPTLAIPA